MTPFARPTSTLILGCGYLGIRVARRLLQRGEVVYGTTRTSKRRDELVRNGIEPVLVDVLDPSTLDRLPSPDRVLYCVGHDRRSQIPVRDVYVDGLRHAIDRLHYRTRRIVFTSSTSVYGDQQGQPVDEQTEPHPTTESGLACLDAERLLFDFADQRAWPVTIVRLAGLYGPGRIMRRATLEAGDPIRASAEGYLNLIHIDDAATAVIAALEMDQDHELFLAADDRPVFRRDFYGLLTRLLNLDPPQFKPPHAPGSRAGDLGKRVSNDRMRRIHNVPLIYPDYTTGLPACLGSAE